MNILYYSTAYSASHGGSNHSKAFVKYAQKNPAVTSVEVFPEKKQGLNVEKKAGNFLSKVLSSPIFLALRFYKRNKINLESVLEKIASSQPDVVVVRLDNNFLQLKAIKQKFPQVILVTEVNASPFDESFKNILFKSYFKKLERRYLRYADLNFFVSQRLMHSILQDSVNSSKDFVNQNGYDPDHFYAGNKLEQKVKIGVPAGNISIGYIGTLDTHKKMDVFIDAAEQVAGKTKHSLSFIIVGGGPMLEELKLLVRERRLQDSFVFTGNVKHEEVVKYLQGFDIAVHHAANEYMSPLKVFEYLGVGVPTIAPDTRAVREVFTEKQHLLLTQPVVADVVNKILWVIDNPSEASVMAKAGQTLVQTSHSWQNNVDFIIGKIKLFQSRA